MTTATDGDSRPKRSSWLGAVSPNVLMIGLVSFFTDASSEMIFPLLPAFLSGLLPAGSVGLYLGLMAGLADTTASILKLFSGRISDALGKRKLLVVLGYGLSTFFRPLTALATAGWQVIVFRVTDRVGKGIRTSPRDALISHSVSPHKRGLAFGFHRAMDHLGAILGPVIAAVILYCLLGRGLWLTDTNVAVTYQEMHALRWVFGLALLPGLAALTTVIFKVREVHPKSEDQPDRTSLQNPTTGQHLPAKFYVFVAIATLFTLGNSSDLFLLLLAKTRFSLGIFSLLSLWVLLHLAKVFFCYLGGALSDRIGRRPLMIAGWITYALAYLGFAGVTQQGIFWALFLAYGLYYGLTEGTERALVADFVVPKQRGTAYGIFHGAVGLAALPASLVFGVLWKFYGPALAFGVGATLAGLSAMLLALLLSKAGPKP